MSDFQEDILRSQLRRDGTSQAQRRLPALDPAWVKLDERTVEDFLVFSNAFARQIQYYDYQNQPDGNWEPFWNANPTVVIATIAKANPLPLKQAFFALQEAEPSTKGLQQLFRLIRQSAGVLNNWLLALDPASAFDDRVARLIQANLETTLPRTLAFEKAAWKKWGDTAFYPQPSPAEYAGFEPVWNLNDFGAIEPDANFLTPDWEPEYADDYPPNPTEEQRLRAAYDKLTGLFTDIYNIVFQVIQLAPAFFDNNLKRSDHPPHIALFLAFLRLYLSVRDDLNRMTGRHLDFFYKDVLQFTERKAVADHVHLFFELAKHLPEYELKKDLRFPAGKDAKGQDVYFALDADTVINKAKIESLRSVFIKWEKDPTTSKPGVTNIYATSKADSENGAGEEIKDKEKPSWATLGNTALPVPQFVDDKLPMRPVGFALASNELLLAEGVRTVTLLITFEADLYEDFEFPVEVWFSGEKEWLKVTKLGANDLALRIHKNEDGSVVLDTLELSIKIDTDQAAIVPFNAEALKENLGTQLPVMKVFLTLPEGANGNPGLDVLLTNKTTNITLQTKVTGVRKLMAFNDQGALDTSKSFLPFGPAPVVGSNFYLGSKEVFQKQITKVDLKVTYENVPEHFGAHYMGYDVFSPDSSGVCDIETLLPGNYITDLSLGGINKNDYKIFQDKVNNINEPNNSKAYTVTLPIFSPNEKFVPFEFAGTDAYGRDSKEGFIRLVLKKDFEHDQYPVVSARQSMAVAAAASTSKNKLTGAYYLNISGATTQLLKSLNAEALGNLQIVIPKPPYTPTIQSLSLDYNSSATLGSDAQAGIEFLHLHPFAGAYQLFDQVGGLTLLPGLQTGDPDKPRSLEGSLLIGIKDLLPGQSLSLLFQVAENTADADIDETIVHWQYLKANKWTNFKEYEIVQDTTKGLITSGLITFTIPEDIDLDNTIQPSGLHWLRAYVDGNAAAVSEMLHIHAQGVRATFQDNKNDPERLQKPLAGGAIAKPELETPALKSTAQPYDSFGGRAPEGPLAFYTRVSERLRHKGRAITIFDYERLALEQYPFLYKVKCINHTNADDQLAPGHLQLAVIPDFTQLKDVDRLSPKVTRAQLTEIREFLEERISLFLCSEKTDNQFKRYVHVVNPEYEKIRVSFKVRFKPEITAFEYYKRQLTQAIIRFLAPWSFDNTATINFGGRVFRSTILDFVEKQPYVDYVLEFRLMSEETKSDADMNFIEARTPRSILVPSEEARFEITEISDASYCPAGPSIADDTLGYATLNQNFTIKNQD